MTEKSITKQINLLHGMARSGDKLGLRQMLREGVPVDLRLPDSHSALILAAGQGQLECVKELLGAGADINLIGAAGMSSLMSALQNSHTETAQLLIERQANVTFHDNSGNTCGHFLSWGKSTSLYLLDMMLERGLDVNSVNNNGGTLLINAVCYGTPQEVRGAIVRGCKLHMVDSEGCSAIHWASENSGSTEILIEQGASVNAKNFKKQTPLHLSRNPEVVNLLLSKGAEIHMPDNQGRTPLLCVIEAIRPRKQLISFDLVSQPHPSEVIGALLVHGADPDLAMYNGLSPRKLINKLCGSGDSDGSADAQKTLLPLLQAYDARRAMHSVVDGHSRQVAP